MQIKEFTGYVLAGGKSSRMGTDKAFLEINGETFLNRAVKTLSMVCKNRVVIVLNQTQTHFIEKLPSNIPYVFDVFENRGAIGGIHAALTNCETEYAIILAVDLPLVSDEVIENLAKIMFSTNEFIALVPRQSDGKFQPLCAVYHPRYCLSPLEELMRENKSASVRDFLETIAHRYVSQEKLTTNGSENIFLNVNFQADLNRLKASGE